MIIDAERRADRARRTARAVLARRVPVLPSRGGREPTVLPADRLQAAAAERRRRWSTGLPARLARATSRRRGASAARRAQVRLAAAGERGRDGRGRLAVLGASADAGRLGEQAIQYAPASFKSAVAAGAGARCGARRRRSSTVNSDARVRRAAVGSFAPDAATMSAHADAPARARRRGRGRAPARGRGARRLDRDARAWHAPALCGGPRPRPARAPLRGRGAATLRPASSSRTRGIVAQLEKRGSGVPRRVRARRAARAPPSRDGGRVEVVAAWLDNGESGAADGRRSSPSSTAAASASAVAPRPRARGRARLVVACGRRLDARRPRRWPGGAPAPDGEALARHRDDVAGKIAVVARAARRRRRRAPRAAGGRRHRRERRRGAARRRQASAAARLAHVGGGGRARADATGPPAPSRSPGDPRAAVAGGRRLGRARKRYRGDAHRAQARAADRLVRRARPRAGDGRRRSGAGAAGGVGGTRSAGRSTARRRAARECGRAVGARRERGDALGCMADSTPRAAPRSTARDRRRRDGAGGEAAGGASPRRRSWTSTSANAACFPRSRRRWRVRGNRRDRRGRPRGCPRAFLPARAPRASARSLPADAAWTRPAARIRCARGARSSRQRGSRELRGTRERDAPRTQR